jgi:RNA-directed DNA polymerase
VQDRVITRLIGKCLKAGVLEGGAISYNDAGSPQGGVISPILEKPKIHHSIYAANP